MIAADQGDGAELGGESVAKAIVVYRSHSGVTRRYGEEIAEFLEGQGVAAQVVSVGECDMSSLGGADFVFLGCWTSGLFVIRQHPDEPWLAFVREMPALARPKIALFTTYKLRTGSQFPRMRAALAGKTSDPQLELKSRDGRLSLRDKEVLERFVR
jgi:flavodoxin